MYQNERQGAGVVSLKYLLDAFVMQRIKGQIACVDITEIMAFGDITFRTFVVGDTCVGNRYLVMIWQKAKRCLAQG